MLTLMLAADASDSGDWNVTTTLAAIAAGISIVTLVVTTYYTSRRETVKWARETLGEAFFDFVNSSYDAGQAGKDHLRLSAAKASSAVLDELVETFDDQRNQLIHIQTRIRLLAPAKTLQAARDLRRRIDDLRTSLNHPLTNDQQLQLIDAIANAREAFIQQAKDDMSLPR